MYMDERSERQTQKLVAFELETRAHRQLARVLKLHDVQLRAQVLDKMTVKPTIINKSNMFLSLFFRKRLTTCTLLYIQYRV